MFYTGVGSRQAPQNVLRMLQHFASVAEILGMVLRSGGADGCDSAFESGCSADNSIIYLPWPLYNSHLSTNVTVCEKAIRTAKHLHPMGDHLRDSHARLHGRNVYQVIGTEMVTPSEFVICWTPDGAEAAHACSSRTGGTSTAIALADQCGIPVFNVARPKRYQAALAFMISASGVFHE